MWGAIRVSRATPPAAHRHQAQSRQRRPPHIAHGRTDDPSPRRTVVHPPSTRPLGLCKGQRVYPRAALHDLKTEERWHREGRTVLMLACQYGCNKVAERLVDAGGGHLGGQPAR